MVLFLLFLMFVIFSEFLYIDTNIIISVYLVYVFIYIITPHCILNTFSFNSFWLKKLFLSFRFFFFKYSNIFKRFKSLFFEKHLVWKPLFKKSSYFGLYRSNKNQWLNK